MTKIVVFGANGHLGSRIVREALDRGHEVVAVVRDRQKTSVSEERLTIMTGDVLSPASVETVGKGADALVSAIGGGDGPRSPRHHRARRRIADHEPGPRSGTYRMALDDLVVDAAGDSRISMEDYAVAVLDEIEKPGHERERFTVGY